MKRAGAFRHHHLDAVADVFLSPTRPAGGGKTALLVAAAPGAADTASVLGALRPDAGPDQVRDLGHAIGVRLGRLERTGEIARDAAVASQLVWCPCSTEALAVTAALTLGRLAALVRPVRITVLWFAGGVTCIGRDPTAAQRERVRRLACAAIPETPVTLHCVGWDDDPMRQLAALAGRFH